MDALAQAITTLATACQRSGVTHLRMRHGPVAELVVLPPVPEETPEEKKERKVKERERELFGERPSDV